MNPYKEGPSTTISVNGGPEMPFEEFERRANSLNDVGPTVKVSVNARAAALAWLNAFLATGQNEDRPLLYRTLAIEFFDAGVQFIGCDGTAIFRAFVPRAPHDEEPGYKEPEWPILAEAPERSIIVMDSDSFAIGFMRTLLRVTNEDFNAHQLLHISTSPIDEGAELSLGEEFLKDRLTLRSCGQRIDLPLFEDKYPNWREAKLGLDAAEHVEGLTIAPRIMAMTGRIKGARAIDLEFYGDSKHVTFTARGDCEVRGLLMPMRREKVEDDS
ncbi:MAG: hypothetical protein ACO1Q7_03965 [Gemmatimonas sp.]